MPATKWTSGRGLVDGHRLCVVAVVRAVLFAAGQHLVVGGEGLGPRRKYRRCRLLQVRRCRHLQQIWRLGDGLSQKRVASASLRNRAAKTNVGHHG